MMRQRLDLARGHLLAYVHAPARPHRADGWPTRSRAAHPAAGGEVLGRRDLPGGIVEPLRRLGRAFFWIDRILIDGIVWMIELRPAVVRLRAEVDVQRGYLQGYAVDDAVRRSR